MEINTQGLTRIVLIFNAFVIKIPNFCQWRNFLQGLLSNIGEAKAWKNAKHQFKGDMSYLLCPVIWSSYGGWILIMKKAKVCSRDEKIDYSEWEKNHLWDNKPSNFGRLDGRLVKIDYGSL